MRKTVIVSLVIAFSVACLGTGAYLLAQQGAPAAGAASAEVEVGLGVVGHEISDAASSFRIAAGTRIYAWTRVTGLADSRITVCFHKGDRLMSRQELGVARSPHRTNAFRTFRKGDDGAWTVKVLGPAGEVLGSADFSVALSE